MSNEDIGGDGPGDAVPPAPVGTPEHFEQQLAKERDARALMRDRLRNTEALAAESHALRARMAQELERVTAERDRLRNSAAAASAAAGSTAAALSSAPKLPAAMPASAPAVVPPIAPPMASHAGASSLRPPAPPRRNGPWLALSMLGGLAVGVAALAWITGSMPGEGTLASAVAPAASTVPGAASTSDVASPPVAAAAAIAPPTASASGVLASAAPASAATLPDGASALPPLTPEAILAAAPSAAGNPSIAAAALPGRLRAALDAEGIVAPVDFDAANGHVAVSDPAADNALRDRTDMIIRAVYAGASLPEPLIEHRWLSAPRAGRAASAALAVPQPPVALASAKTPVHAMPARQVEHAKRVERVAEAPEARPILPAGRVTAACKAGVTSQSTVHRTADVAACMKHSCCNSANRQTEECRAYDKAYPLRCGAG